MSTTGKKRRWRIGGGGAVAALVLVGATVVQATDDQPVTHDQQMAEILEARAAEAPVVTADPAPEVAVGRATCGAGSRPETGLQGEVPRADRDSGRAHSGYSCNLEQVSAPLGDGAGLQAAYYGNCAYYGSIPGTRVVDVTDRAKPVITTMLSSPAMIDPWESLKVHAGRGLLAAVEGTLNGPLFFDIYDIKENCAKPELLASVPVNALGHEGEFSADGMIYYATGFLPGTLTAIDVTDPRAPRAISSAVTGQYSHGLSTNPSGDRLYLADPDLAGTKGTGQGLLVLDMSDVLARRPLAQPREVGALRWPDGGYAQHTIFVRYRGVPHVVFIDESAYGAVRIIDISDETKPRVVTNIRTEIQLVQNRARADATETGFAYNDHYCNVDRVEDPTALACSSRASGIRVFDIRKLDRVREIAYFNPGGDAGGDGAGESTAQVYLDPVRGELWSTHRDKGFFVTRFTNGVWPFKAPGPKPRR